MLNCGIIAWYRLALVIQTVARQSLGPAALSLSHPGPGFVSHYDTQTFLVPSLSGYEDVRVDLLHIPSARAI